MSRRNLALFAFILGVLNLHAALHDTGVWTAIESLVAGICLYEVVVNLSLARRNR